MTRAEISVAESHFLTLPTNPHFARQGVHATNGKSHDAHSTANDNNPPTPQDICTPPPYTGGSNKQSKLSMTSTREGDLKGTTIKGGLGWPVQQRAAFIPPPKHRFPTIPPSDGEKEKQAQVVRPEGPQDTNSLPIPQEGQTNKPSFTKTQLQGEIVGNDDQGGGLGWPVPTARCFHPSTRPIPDNFPFQQSKRKTSTSYIQTERERPPALAPNTNDTPRPNNIPMMMMDSDSFQTRARRSRCPKIIAKQTKDRKKRTSKHALSRKEDVSSLTYPKPPNTQKEKGSEFSYP